jgi:hypothetical protein
MTGSKRTPDVRAADPQGKGRTRFLSGNDDEVGESIARCASRAPKNRLCERRYRALAVLRWSERTRFCLGTTTK